MSCLMSACGLLTFVMPSDDSAHCSRPDFAGTLKSWTTNANT